MVAALWAGDCATLGNPPFPVLLATQLELAVHASLTRPRCVCALLQDNSLLHQVFNFQPRNERPEKLSAWEKRMFR